MKPAEFLKNFDQVIFDMDGVITSERNYWTCAALSVYELCNSDRYFGKSKLDLHMVFNNREEISKLLFYNDKLIILLKNLGVNVNWDLAYVLLAGMIGLGERRDFSNIYSYYKYINLQAPVLYDHAAALLSKHFPDKDCRRYGEIWQILQQSFCEWYYGDELYELYTGNTPKTEGKQGLMTNEQPYHSLIATKDILSTLKNNGIKIGVGTGRPKTEFEVPMRMWKMMDFFEKDNIVTLDDILDSQHQLGEAVNLTKPHPFTFLKAAFGKRYTDEQLLHQKYEKSLLKRVLIVGDAGADILAAQAMDTKFAAVLTGVNGKDSRDYFVEMKADYILDSVLDFAVPD